VQYQFSRALPYRSLLILLWLFTQQVSWMPEFTKPAWAQDLNPRIIRFGGHRWMVKSGSDLAPRKNDWSDDERSVWIGTDGKLHLQIRYQAGKSYSAQIISIGFAAYGLYRFYVESPVNRLDANVVLGLFLYADDQNEIDIEFKREAGSADNAQYVMQPYTTAGNRHTFSLDHDGPTIHEVDWQADYVAFRSIAGDDPAGGEVLQEWRYEKKDIPTADRQLRIEMNLWLVNPNVQTQPVEVVIENLETTPCANPLPPAPGQVG
jgi:hypothetical protein